MRRYGMVAMLGGCALLASCKGMKIVTDDSGTRVEGAPAAAGSEDRHWIQSDEVFVVQYEGQESLPCFEVTPARMVEAASEATKGQAKVFELRAGKERWSACWWNSRPAQRADLKPGTRVIFFKGPMAGGRSHGAPPSREAARPGADAWFCSTISDDSDLFKGEVKVAGYDYAVKEEALRVVVP